MRQTSTLRETHIHLETNGGPGTDNMLIVQYIYTTGFDKMRVGYASAASMVLFVILLLLGLAQMKIGGGKNDI